MLKRSLIPQPLTVKVHKSTEHATMTPVFGTTCPPRGLSGMLRDYAYSKGEGRLSHWFLLMLADRINVMEGLASDVARGHVPNFFKERGWRSEFTHVGKKRLARNLAIAGGIVGGVAALAALLTKKQKASVATLPKSASQSEASTPSTP